jgi:hypothetical protein
MKLVSTTEFNLLVGVDYYEADKGNVSQVGYKSALTAATPYGGLSNDKIKTGCADATGAAIDCETMIFAINYVTGRADDDYEGFKVILVDPANPTVRFAPFDRLHLTINSNVDGVVQDDRTFFLEKQTDPAGEDYYVHGTGGEAKDQLFGNILLKNINNQLSIEIKAYYL